MIRWSRVNNTHLVLPLGRENSQNVQAGDGWDAMVPGKEYQAANQVVKPPQPAAGVSMKPDDLLASQWHYEYVFDYRAETRLRTAYFGASLAGIGSGSGSGSSGSISTEENHILYAFLTRRGDSPVEISNPKLKIDPIVSESDSIELRWKKFASTYGTHWCRAVIYGFTLVVRVVAKKTVAISHSAFKADVEASLGNLRAGVTVSSSSLLRENGVTVELTSVGGSYSPTLIGIEQVSSYFKKLGSHSLKTGPIEVDLLWMRTLLGGHPQVEELLYPSLHSTGSPASAPFGVPRGTVIAWRPSASDVEFNTDGVAVAIKAPVGWEICNDPHSLNLVGRFIRGVDEWSGVGRVAGANEIDLTIEGPTREGHTKHYSGNLQRAGSGGGPAIEVHSHQFRFDYALNNMPEHVCLVYIIKT